MTREKAVEIGRVLEANEMADLCDIVLGVDEMALRLDDNPLIEKFGSRFSGPGLAGGVQTRRGDRQVAGIESQRTLVAKMALEQRSIPHQKIVIPVRGRDAEVFMGDAEAKYDDENTHELRHDCRPAPRCRPDVFTVEPMES